MKKQYAVLWAFVLLLSLSLIIFLVVIPKQRDEPPATVTPLPTSPPQALIVAPTRFLPTVAAAPTATIPIPPTPYPTMTAFAVTLAAPEPRVFDAANIVNSQSMLVNFCTDFGTPVSLRIFDWSTGSTISLSDAAIAQIPLSWDASKTIWQGYGSARPFNQPNDTQERWKINLFLPDGTERWIRVLTSPQTPDVDYVYSFQQTSPFAGTDGQHYGDHPCRAFTIASSSMQSFLSVVNQYQNVVRYPALIGGNDPRWTMGMLSPVNAYADLRSIPSTVYNDPIGSIDKSVNVWFAFDPTWNGWGQVKVGAVQGWVDLALVKFTAGG